MKRNKAEWHLQKNVTHSSWNCYTYRRKTSENWALKLRPLANRVSSWCVVYDVNWSVIKNDWEVSTLSYIFLGVGAGWEGKGGGWGGFLWDCDDGRAQLKTSSLSHHVIMAGFAF